MFNHSFLSGQPSRKRLIPNSRSSQTIDKSFRQIVAKTMINTAVRYSLCRKIRKYRTSLATIRDGRRSRRRHGTREVFIRDNRKQTDLLTIITDNIYI